jgi:hypothetical protein
MYETSFNIQPALQKVKSPVSRMKSFIETDATLVEEKVNDWLTNSKVNISHIGQSQCERNGRLLFVLNVFYSEW